MFSVIIPTYHRNDLLAKCLDCLAPGAQSLSIDQYEVIVTDDGRETTAEQMILEHYPWVKWVAGPQKGPAANRNNGAKYAQGEWLVFTDDDCLPDSHWLEAYAQAIDDSVLALEGSIHPLGDLNQDLAECPVNLTGGCFWSANIAVKRSLFEQVDGFDENYILAAQEDQDLKIKLETLIVIKFIPDAKVYHPVRIISFRKAITLIPLQIKNWLYYSQKNDLISKSGGIFCFAAKQYRFHFSSLLSHLQKHKYQSLFLSLIILIYGLLLAWIELIYQSIKSKRDKYFFRL